MFTGIIEATGLIHAIEPKGGGTAVCICHGAAAA